MTVRAIAERVSHRLVMRRRLPPPFHQARIYASSEGGLRYLKPTLSTVDPTLLRLVSQTVRPGATVWDIGANVGLFAFSAALMAGPAGSVLAVEPDGWLVDLLRRSTTLNQGGATVEVLPVAISDATGVSRFTIAKRNRSTSHLAGFGTTQTGGVRRVEVVPTVTLDWLAGHFPPPDVLKIDVEAAEALVLSGGAGVLAGGPTIICEVAGENAPRVAELLRAHGYRCYDGSAVEPMRSPVDVLPMTTLAVARAAYSSVDESPGVDVGDAGTGRHGPPLVVGGLDGEAVVTQ